MELGTKVKIIDTSGQFPEELMHAGGEIMNSCEGGSLVRIPGQKDIWIYNFRLGEVEDDE